MVRFDEMNACALDFGCHQYFHENPREFENFYRKLIGKREFDLLSARARQIGKPDINGIYLYYREKLKEFEE